MFNHTNRIFSERGQDCPSFNNDTQKQAKTEGKKNNLSMSVIMDECKYTACAFFPHILSFNQSPQGWKSLGNMQWLKHRNPVPWGLLLYKKSYSDL